MVARLGELLLDGNHLTPGQLEQAVEYQRTHGASLAAAAHRQHAVLQDAIARDQRSDGRIDLEPIQLDGGDADLTTAEAPDGERRTLAAGAERWFRRSRLAVRGGVRAQTIGDVRPVATGGASVGIWSGLLLEGQVTLGGDEVERGWGLGARVTF